MKMVSTFFIAAFIMLQTSAQAQTLSQPVDTGFIFGANWSGDVGDSVMSNTLGFNNFHTWSALTPTLLNTIEPHGTYTYIAPVISPYSAGQRFLYSAVPKPLPGDPNVADTLRRFYFLHMDSTIGKPFSTNLLSPWSSWEVDSSSDSSHSNNVVMSQNEMGGEWNYTFAGEPALLAVRMQVLDTMKSGDHDTIVASVIVQFDTTYDAIVGGQHVRYGPVDTFNIRWSWFHTLKDTCFFSNGSGAFGRCYIVPDSFKYNQNCDVDCEGGTELTVMSRRIVSFRLASVVITDSIADALLSGLPAETPTTYNLGYDSSNVARRNTSDSLVIAIQDAADSIDNILGNRREYFYLQDEETMSQFAASRQTNMTLDTTGVTEMQRPYSYTRYIAQVQPKVFIYPGFSVGGFSRAAYLNSGINDYNADSTDTTQRIADYDTSSPGVNAVGHASIGNAWDGSTGALISASARQYGLAHWWADVFNYGAVDTTEHYTIGTIPTPEEFSAAFNSALAFGASGIWVYTNTNRTGGGACIGFTDSDGTRPSDYFAFHGSNTVPVMWKRNSQFAKNFSTWLQSYANEIYKIPWKGGHIRGIYPYDGTGIMDSTFGTLSIVDPSQDHESRYIMSHWGNPETDTSIHTILDTSYVPPFLVYGEFDDPNNIDRKWLYSVNLYQDCRSLNNIFVKDSDANFTQRGSRILWTKMSLDSTKSRWWDCRILDSTNTDTIVAFNGYYRQFLLPGGAHITRITPYLPIFISNYGVAYNNATHLIRHDSLTSRIVYMRNDSIFTRRIIGDSSAAEVIVCAGGLKSIDYNGSETYYTTYNSYPAVARHRAFPEDMIIWERVNLGLGTTVKTEILGAVINDNDTIISTTNYNYDRYLQGPYFRISAVWYDDANWDTIKIENFRTTGSLSFLATPSITGLDSGWASRGLTLRKEFGCRLEDEYLV